MNRTVMIAGILASSVAVTFAADADRPAVDSDRQTADETAVRVAVDAYVKAFNQADAKGLAALWSAEAVYTNPISGEQVVGRAAIEKQFSDIFAGAKGSKLAATTESVRFVSPSVAIEQGTATVVRPEQPAEETAYTAVYVKSDGKWLLDRVTEADSSVAASHYDQLKELEWMIGTWIDQDDQCKIETTCAWTKNQNFITRSFTVSAPNQIDMAGMQIVGWDPVGKRIRSWVFDSDGGFGEGVWSKKDNRWFIRAVGATPDGKRTSAVNVITHVDDDTFTWQSVDRVVDGELLPNVDELAVVRQASAD